MVVLILESVPTGLRGELSKWMLEPRAGVFVGTVSAAVRDLLWEKACQECGEGGCTLIYRAANEQGFAIRSFGDTARSIEEWEGRFLVRRPAPKPDASPPTAAWEQMLHPEVWAKSPNRVELTAGEGQYHPLICHMIDVAMVARRLWQYVLPPALREQFRAGLGLPADDDAGRWIAFFAGLHDLGKATPCFAKQWDEGWKALLRRGYRGAKSDERKPHAVLSTYLLEPLLARLGLPKPWLVARVVGGHHGLFPTDEQLARGNRFSGDGLWAEAQANLVTLLAHVLGIDRLPPPTGDLEQANGLLVILAGLVSVADWIASDHANFPFAGDGVRLPSYPRRSRWLAWKALHRLGWFHRPHALEPRPFPELFDKVPNRLQEQVIAVAPELQGPSLVLIEYPMGGGKTEAALYLADYLAAQAGQRGAYFALPTMATSNQMFGRVSTYLQNRFPNSAVNVQLLHGHAALNAEFAVLRQAGRGELLHPTGVDDNPESGLLPAEWFTYAKRGLLAPYGIGTIDQALLAVLQTRHFFVRLFGLAGKVVIFDEVHAYDTYMRTLLTRLLAWLGACGTSVVLLSATLPARTRQELLAAYAAGRGRPAPPDDPAVAYPRIAWLSDAGSNARHIAGAAERRLALRPCNQADEAWMVDLQAALAEGGCAAVILNTVTRAQQVCRQLQAHFPAEELTLLHARFPFDDRQVRESTVLARFGPGEAERPHRAVVVATQVIEQSLDLDFDLMISDLAPVDLLLQRSGRCWRHARARRPPSLAGPALWVLQPLVDEQGRPEFEPGSARVYDPHTLLRTWLALLDRSELVIPQDVEALVEAVYSERTSPAELPEAIRTLWSQTWDKLKAEEDRDAVKAQRRYIPEVTGDLFGLGLAGLDEEDEGLHQAHRAMTRLGGPSVSVVCLTAEGGRLWAGADREIDLERRLNTDDLRTLLGRSLRISFDPGLVRQILDTRPPSTWQGTVHLRRHRLLAFSPDGACITAGLPLRLDPELGLLRLREEEET